MRRRAAFLIVALFLAAFATPGFVAPASAAPPGATPPTVTTVDANQQVTVELTNITPLSPGPKDTLRVAGRVVNHTGAQLSSVAVSLHRGRAVASRTELHDLRTSPVDQVSATGSQPVGDGKLAPGQSLSFLISTPMSQLELPSAGVYPLQVLATGVRDGQFQPVDLDRASTFLPYIPAEQQTPATPLSWVVSLTAKPPRLADGTFASNDVVDSVAAGGRLRRLLDALGKARSATAVLDPTIIQALAIAASGSYPVAAPALNPTAPITRHPASTDARSWLADLRAADNTSLIGLPYADTDIEATLHAGQRATADDALRRTSQVLDLGLLGASSRLTSAVAVPPGGAVDTTGATYYRTAAKAKGLILNADAVPATGDNPGASATVPGVGVRLLLNDSALSQLVTSGPAGNPRMAEQEVVAELAEAHLEDGFAATPDEGASTSAAAPLLIAPGTGWNPTQGWIDRLLTDTGRLRWLQQVPVADLLASTPQPRARLQYPPAARNAELPAALVNSSANLASAAGGLFRTPVRGDIPQPRTPESIVRPIRDATLAAVSSSGRRDLSQGATFVDSAQRSFSALQQGVRVVASPQVTLTSRSGKVPVTLENDLQAAVDVSLVLTSIDRSRVTSGTVVQRTVRAGQKVQVEVEVHAASAGTFPVKLALFSPDGQPLGTPAQVLVRSTTYGVVATVFTIVALSILGLAVIIRAIRGLVRRSRRPEPPQPTPTVAAAPKTPVAGA